MDRARQRRLDARERRRQSLQLSSMAVETPVVNNPVDEKKAKMMEKAKKLSNEKNITIEEAISELKARAKAKKLRLAQSNDVELASHEQGVRTATVKSKGKE